MTYTPAWSPAEFRFPQAIIAHASSFSFRLSLSVGHAEAVRRTQHGRDIRNCVTVVFDIRSTGYLRATRDVMITDKLGNYEAAKQEGMTSIEQR